MRRVEMTEGEKQVVEDKRDREVFLLLRQIRSVPTNEVAQRAGVCRATVAKLRRPINRGGTRYPRQRTTILIAKAFGMRWQLVDKDGRVLR